MAPARSDVSPSGQVTLPDEVRRELGLHPTGQVEIEVMDGRAVLTPVRRSFLDFYMSVPALDPPMTDEEMEEAFEQGVADEVMASMNREERNGE